jgi:hypothetical protein
VRFPRRLISLTFATAAFVGVASVAGVMMTAQNSYAVTVVHSNDVLGEIEPCGCRTNPLGGYARKANLLKSLKDREIIQIDAGDLLFPSQVIPELLKQQSEFQARYVLKTLDELHQDVVVPGEKDLAMGTGTFLKLISKTKIHFLAANLFRKKGGELLPASVILTRKDTDGKTVRVAILGLVGTDLDWPKDLKASDPIQKAAQLVPGLRKKADYVIAVTHQGLDDDKKLAAKVKGIDYIIGGHTQSFLQTPLVVKSAGGGSTTILQSSFRNQYIGVLDLNQQAQKDAKKDATSDSSYQLLGLDPNYDSPAGKPSKTDQLVDEFKTKLGEMNSRQDDVVPVNSTASKYQTFPRCAECHLKQFDFWRKTPHMNALRALVLAKQDKNKECLMCHTVGLGDPQGVNSVNQLAQIKPQTPSSEESGDDADSAKSADTDAAKAAHSSVGLFLPNEEFVRYLSEVSAAKTIQDPVHNFLKKDSTATFTVHNSLAFVQNGWTPVQCENCHGAGHDHPFSGTMPKKVENTTCLSCHTQERAPEWYGADGKPNWDKIAGKHAQIACPAGDMTL